MSPGRAPELRCAAGEVRFIPLGMTRSGRRFLPPFQGLVALFALTPGCASLACDYDVRTIHFRRQMYV